MKTIGEVIVLSCLLVLAVGFVVTLAAADGIDRIPR